MTEDLSMWRWHADERGLESAMNNYPETIKADPILSAAWGQYLMAQHALRTRMAELVDQQERPD